MKYSKKKLFLVIIGILVVLSAAVVTWQLLPSSMATMRGSVVMVEQTTWQEVLVDGKPKLYFNAVAGDSALLGVTANRDSALHHRRVAGCWVNRWQMLPSCFGRIVTVACPTPSAPKQNDDSTIVRLCKQSIAMQLKTLKAQKAELDYYLRVHGVQDNGYQRIAALTTRLTATYNDVERAAKFIDSLANAKNHKFGFRTMATYTAFFRDSEGKRTKADLFVAERNTKRGIMLLKTKDETTPDGARPLSISPWNHNAERDIRAVGFPGLGENGLECDTISPAIIPGHKTKGNCHDLPTLLASDGAPVFTAKGRFIGIIKGKTIVSDINCLNNRTFVH